MAEEATPTLARTVEDATREALQALTGTGEPEAPAPAAEPEAAQPGVESTPATESQSQEPEAPAVQASEEETPTEWFGVDLTGLPAEKRAEIISGFKERDKVINRLFQERKTAPTEAPPGEAPPAPQPETQSVPEPLSDQDLLKQLGFDENDPLFEVKAEVALPLAKAIMQQNEIVNQMYQERQVQQALDQWNSEMTALEGQFGQLPEGVTQEDVLDFALQNGLSSPAETYFKLVGPLRKEVGDLAREARQAIREKTGTGPRPRTTTETAPKQFEGKVGEVFKDAAAAAAKDLGTSWVDAAKASGWAGSELEDDTL